MKSRIVQIGLYSVLGLILILSIFVKTILNFQANKGISILVFALVFIFILNFFLKKIETKATKTDLENSAEAHDKLTLQRFFHPVFYSIVLSFYILLTSSALFALQTQYFGYSNTVILKGQITQPSFTLSRNPCIQRLQFPRSEWSTLSYLCLDEYPAAMQKNGYYQLKLKTSFFGANVIHFQWIDDQLDPKQRMNLEMDPQLKKLLKSYSEFQQKLGPPITMEEAQELDKPDQSQ